MRTVWVYRNSVAKLHCCRDAETKLPDRRAVGKEKKCWPSQKSEGFQHFIRLPLWGFCKTYKMSTSRPIWTAYCKTGREITMSDNNEPKKVSLQDAIRQKLAQKKEQANTGNQSSAYFEGGPKAMKSQNNKKPNNQRRRTGGS